MHDIAHARLNNKYIKINDSYSIYILLHADILRIWIGSTQW